MRKCKNEGENIIFFPEHEITPKKCNLEQSLKGNYSQQNEFAVANSCRKTLTINEYFCNNEKQSTNCVPQNSTKCKLVSTAKNKEKGQFPRDSKEKKISNLSQVKLNSICKTEKLFDFDFTKDVTSLNTDSNDSLSYRNSLDLEMPVDVGSIEKSKLSYFHTTKEVTSLNTDSNDSLSYGNSLELEMPIDVGSVQGSNISHNSLISNNKSLPFYDKSTKTNSNLSEKKEKRKVSTQIDTSRPMFSNAHCDEVMKKPLKSLHVEKSLLDECKNQLHKDTKSSSATETKPISILNQETKVLTLLSIEKTLLSARCQKKPMIDCTFHNSTSAILYSKFAENSVPQNDHKTKNSFINFTKSTDGAMPSNTRPTCPCNNKQPNVKLSQEVPVNVPAKSCEEEDKININHQGMTNSSMNSVDTNTSLAFNSEQCNCYDIDILFIEPTITTERTKRKTHSNSAMLSQVEPVIDFKHDTQTTLFCDLYHHLPFSCHQTNTKRETHAMTPFENQPDGSTVDIATGVHAHDPPIITDGMTSSSCRTSNKGLHDELQAVRDAGVTPTVVKVWWGLRSCAPQESRLIGPVLSVCGELCVEPVMATTHHPCHQNVLMTFIEKGGVSSSILDDLPTRKTALDDKRLLNR